MNAERLHAIVNAVREDVRTWNVTGLMEQLVSALQNQVNQPTAPQFQDQVGHHFRGLSEALTKMAINSYVPTWKQTLDETGVRRLLGNSLKEQIEAILLRNQITPSVALQELQELHRALQTLMTALENLTNGLDRLAIGSEELKAGECEVGLLVPRGFVDNRLDKLGDEISELDHILEVFAEVATGSRPSFVVRTISSTDFALFLETAPAVGACVAVAVERIVALYKQLLEIRRLHNELAQQNVERKSLKGIEEHANGMMEKGIETLVKDLLNDFYKNGDDGRRNELKVELRFALKKIANRVDRGFNLEVRMEQPEPTEPSESDANARDETSKHFERIASAAQTLSYVKLEGEPILSLPESSEDKSKRK